VFVRVLVTGGAGFVGSHLCELLIERGDVVVCLDDLSTGLTENVEHLSCEAAFTFIEGSVLDPIDIAGDFDGVLHLASPASPPAYLANPIFTLRTGSEGTRNALEFAREKGARFEWHRQARCTATRWCILNPKVTGVTSIPRDPAACTTRPSVTPRR
jgi:dTDP-glucose 4,6-dehydratase